jgi:hypothetical protein
MARARVGIRSDRRRSGRRGAGEGDHGAVQGRSGTTATGSGLGGLRKEDTVISACMARNGYIRAQ